MKSKPSQTIIDQYIASQPEHIKIILDELKKVIKDAAPDAEEIINYGIPTFTLQGNLVHFAAYKTHIGFYPAPSGIMAFKKELSVYKGAKGSVQFPLEKPLPFDLISLIVKFRVQENLEKAALKEKKKALKTCPEGHKFYKTSDCPSCPVCEEQKKPKGGFLSTLAAPARRALENNGIKTLKQLAKFSEVDILKLHGVGPGSIPKLRDALQAEGLAFKN